MTALTAESLRAFAASLESGAADAMSLKAAQAHLHQAHGALQISDTGIVMELGRLFMTGPAAEVIADPRIKVAYLGG